MTLRLALRACDGQGSKKVRSVHLIHSAFFIVFTFEQRVEEGKSEDIMNQIRKMVLMIAALPLASLIKRYSFSSLQKVFTLGWPLSQWLREWGVCATAFHSGRNQFLTLRAA